MASIRPNYMHTTDTLSTLVAELSRTVWDAQCYVENADAAGLVTPEVLREFASRLELAE